MQYIISCHILYTLGITNQHHQPYGRGSQTLLLESVSLGRHHLISMIL